MLLGQQKCSFDKVALGFNQWKNEKNNKNFFVKAKSSTTSYVTCNYCGQKKHNSHACTKIWF